MSEMVVLAAENIDGGAMLLDLNLQLEETCAAVARNFMAHGVEGAHVPSAEVTLKIKISKSTSFSADEYFEVERSIKSTLPAAPKKTSLTLLHDGKFKVDGRGSDKGDPKQTSILEPGDGMEESN